MKRDDIPVSALDYHVYYQLVPSLLMNDDIFAAATEAAEQRGSGCDDAEQAVKKVSNEWSLVHSAALPARSTG